MRALILMTAVLALALAGAPRANAQSFDGIYKGTNRSTEETIITGGRVHRCPPIGTVQRLEFRVAGQTITVATPRESFSGTVSSDGRFTISAVPEGLGLQRGASLTWTGQIEGTQINGAFQFQGAGTICRAVFSAKK